MTKCPALPLTWYRTVDEAAAELGVHRDQLLYYADAGLIVPAARAPKSVLPSNQRGPAPHVVVILDAFRDMDWQPDGADMVAPLQGPHRAFFVDGHGFTSVHIPEPTGAFVRRSQLLITTDQLEVLAESGQKHKPPHPAKLRSLYRAIGVLANSAFGSDVGPYSIADSIVTELQLLGIEGSDETYAKHIRDARAELVSAAGRASTGTESVEPELDRAA